MAVVVILFLVNLDSIKSSLAGSKFVEILETRKPETTVQSAPRADPADSPGLSPSAQPDASNPVATAPGTSSSTPPVSAPVPAVEPPPAPTPLSGAQGSSQQLPQGTSPQTRVVSLYFVRIEDDGVITRQEVKRAIPVSDSPLEDTLNALIAGPTEDELRRKLINLVPRGTKLLGVGIRGSTATIDLSDAFMYNRYGIEGYAGQLKQVVYTATAFPGIQDVQILIEGNTREYLGGEGVYIGKPISRNSF